MQQRVGSSFPNQGPNLSLLQQKLSLSHCTARGVPEPHPSDLVEGKFELQRSHRSMISLCRIGLGV